MQLHANIPLVAVIALLALSSDLRFGVHAAPTAALSVAQRPRGDSIGTAFGGSPNIDKEEELLRELDVSDGTFSI
ncbi:hypothetical protein PsYK624_118570 [Phanerochaete sordida]|uniref:RxLR effector protein n=1 Tax=Phanerochaete sordida TaxID=48140 RepID=A0A9P3GJ09_9APHY|nr:hypothetical protein PsYK624_118570 [Phanerochaete sordida]